MANATCKIYNALNKLSMSYPYPCDKISRTKCAKLA